MVLKKQSNPKINCEENLKSSLTPALRLLKAAKNARGHFDTALFMAYEKLKKR